MVHISSFSFKPTISSPEPHIDAAFIPKRNGQPIPGALPGAISKSVDPTIVFAAAATLRGDGCLMVGTIQNMLSISIHADFGKTAAGPFPTSFVVSVKTPIRDHVGPGQNVTTDWVAFRMLGGCGFDDIPAGFTLGSSNPVQFSTADRPGGNFPLLKDFRGDRLSVQKLVIQHRFVTWFAARAPGADPTLVTSYFFFQHVIWVVDRAWDILWNPSGPELKSTKNGNQIVENSDGRGSLVPLLVGPDAGSSMSNGFNPSS